VLVRNHSFDLRRIGVAYQNRLAQLLLALMRLRGQHMAQMRMPALHFSRRRFLEALRRALVRLKFWHKSSVKKIVTPSPPDSAAVALQYAFWPHSHLS
jgi:hypothetical protein